MPYFKMIFETSSNLSLSIYTLSSFYIVMYCRVSILLCVTGLSYSTEMYKEGHHDAMYLKLKFEFQT